MNETKYAYIRYEKKFQNVKRQKKLENILFLITDKNMLFTVRHHYSYLYYGTTFAPLIIPNHHHKTEDDIWYKLHVRIVPFFDIVEYHFLHY